jgi:hypothetical protein
VQVAVAVVVFLRLEPALAAVATAVKGLVLTGVREQRTLAEAEEAAALQARVLPQLGAQVDQVLSS